MNQLSPIFIASPVRRSGTTLLQRLLCSSSDTVIYGEPAANDLNLLTNISMTKHMMYDNYINNWDNNFEKVLSGEVNDWIADLMPPIQGYQQIFDEALLSHLRYLESEAHKKDRSIWGIKMAEWPPALLRALQSKLPASRLIYLVRQLEDCVRSAKRAGMLNNLQEINQFCHIWQQHIHFMQSQYPNQRVLWMSFEALVQNPERCLQQIAQFSGAGSIQSEVMQHRINTFKSDLQGDPSGQGYMKPVELTEEEKEVLAKYKLDVQIA